jgi:two-component system, OmpR family, phosphate regulon sensor histidine kinase PhoR
MAQLERKTDLAELLLEAARVLGQTLEPEAVYDRFHELLSGVIEHDGVIVSSYDQAEDLLRCDYAWSDGNRLDTSVFPPLPLNRSGEGMQSRVIVTGEPLLTNEVAEQVQRPGGTYYDVDKEGTLRKVPETGPTKTKAAMMVPVWHEGQVVGVVQVMSSTVAYSPEQLELLEGLVAQMAAAVRNARLQRDRRRAEAAEAAALAAAAERQQAATVLEAVGDGIFLVDSEGVIRFWNSAAAMVTGVSVESARDRPASEVFREWPSIADQVPVAESGGTGRSVILPTSSGGRDLWLSFLAVQIAEGVVYTFRDVTSERRLEEERSDFIATISHELRTPMAAVYGAAETLRRREGQLERETERQLLDVIATQAERLAQITEEVLLATKLDRGDLTLEREVVDVGKLARETVGAMQAQVPPSTELELETGSDVVAASGDSDRLQQVLINLIDNAVKHGGGGPVNVSVSSDPGLVRMTVADSGPGIPVAEQPRIFEKFYRAGSSLTRSPGGTGLGLYISRELVQRMGGRLDVRSEPGAGAAFTVELEQANGEA